MVIIIAKRRKKLSDFLSKYYELMEEHKDDIIDWKNIELGDTPIYEINNQGLVRRLDNKSPINPFHSYRKDKNGNIDYSRPTYLRVQLYYYENGERKKKHCEISRLVAKVFIPIPDKYLEQGLSYDDLEVNHIHGGYEIYNNFVSNLEWCTTKENIEKAFETGLRHPPYGDNHHYTFLTTNDVIKICECLEKGMNAKNTYDSIKFDSDLSFEKFKPTFYSIKYGKSWNHISQYYNF